MRPGDTPVTRPLGGQEYHVPESLKGSVSFEGYVSPVRIEGRRRFLAGIENLAPNVIEDLQGLFPVYEQVLRLVEDRLGEGQEVLPINLNLQQLEGWLRYLGDLERREEPTPRRPFLPPEEARPTWLGSLEGVLERLDQVNHLAQAESAENSQKPEDPDPPWFERAWASYQRFLHSLLSWGKRYYLLDPWILDEATVNLSLRRSWNFPTHVWAGSWILEEGRIPDDLRAPQRNDGRHRVCLSFERIGVAVQPPAFQLGLEDWPEYLARAEEWRKNELTRLARQLGLERAPRKTSGDMHFHWLVRFQVLGETQEQIAASPLKSGKPSPGAKGYTLGNVQHALKDTAEIIGLTRRSIPPYLHGSL